MSIGGSGGRAVFTEQSQSIAWAQLGRLVYGAGDEKRGYRRYAPDVLHPRTEVVSGVCAEEATEMMKRFFAGKR